MSYGSRQEMVRAVRRLAADIASGAIKADAITEEDIAQALDTAELPERPDLLIRTGGEQRLSNFLLWQSAYTEFYVTPALWPDFDKSILRKPLRITQNGSAGMEPLENNALRAVALGGP